MIDIIAALVLGFAWGTLTALEWARSRLRPPPEIPSIVLEDRFRADVDKWVRTSNEWTENITRHTAVGRGVWDASTPMRAEVWDVDRVELLSEIVEIDTNRNTLAYAYKPLRLDGGDVATYEVAYRKIHAIYGGNPWPVLFHCYGRIEK